MDISVMDVVSFIGAATGIVIALNARKATKADIIGKLQGSLEGALDTIEQMRVQAIAQGNRITALETASILLRRYVKALIRQLIDNKIKPLPPPAGLDLE